MNKKVRYEGKEYYVLVEGIGKDDKYYYVVCEQEITTPISILIDDGKVEEVLEEQKQEDTE